MGGALGVWSAGPLDRGCSVSVLPCQSLVRIASSKSDVFLVRFEVFEYFSRSLHVGLHVYGIINVMVLQVSTMQIQELKIVSPQLDSVLSDL